MARSALQVRRRADNESEILDAARAIVVREGPGALTLGAVAAQVGVTTPALYHYFDSKIALLQALIVNGVSSEADMLIAVAEGWHDDEAALLGGIVEAMHRHYRPNLSSFRLIYLHLQLGGNNVFNPKFLKLLNPHSRRMFDAVEAVVKRGQAAGRVRPELEARTAVVSAHATAIGLLTMLALAESAGDPLRQRDETLLRSMSELLMLGARVR